MYNDNIKTITTLNPDGSLNCPNCTNSIDPKDCSDDNYIILESNFQPKGFVLLLKCVCGQLIKVEVSE